MPTRASRIAVMLAALAFALTALLAERRADAQSHPAAFVPGATLQDDLKGLTLPLLEGYAKARPRLLYGAADRAAIQAKAKAAPQLWERVLASAKGVGAPAPDANEIQTGAHYWRIERVQSAALAWFVTGEKSYAEGAAKWMVAYCKEPLWGLGWGQNVDLQASWYLYHIGIAYDTLHGELSEADRKVIRDGLATHAQAVFGSLSPDSGKAFRYPDGFRYDQNHTYIPAVGLATAALALRDEERGATHWLSMAYAVMRRCRYSLGEDGYYYEGTGYWTYALH